MKRAVKSGLAIVAAAIVLGLFLLPVVQITVANPNSCQDVEPPCVPMTWYSTSSVTYAYFGIGAVYAQSPPNPYGQLTASTHSYCLISGNPGMMCGYSMERMTNGHVWMMG